MDVFLSLGMAVPRPGMDWGGTISVKAWIGAGPSLFDAGLLLFGMGQSHMDVLSLDPGYLSLCTHSAGRV